jgi:histidinol-phosphate aminotransferase
LSLRPRPEVEHLEASPHGGLNQAELKAMNLTPEAVLDFSVCSNPFPPPLGVSRVLDTVAVNRYPDSEATGFRQRLSEKLGVAPDNIMAGSGAVELIRLIALAYFGHGDCVLVLEPTFGEYSVACQIAGAEVIKNWCREEDSFTLNIEETAGLIRKCRPKGVFICNPNNPTGQYLTREEVESILDVCGSSLLILDEAYVSFAEGSWPSIDLIHSGNIVIVRSMTKDYALAGLRLGYAVSSQKIISALHRVRPPWNVNAVAQKAGVIALKDTGYLEHCKAGIGQAKQFLVDELSRIGFTLVPSKANFFLVEVKNATGFRTALLKHGMLVRDCTSFGLPDYVRIAPRTMPECEKLIAAIKALKGQGELELIPGTESRNG